MDEREMYEKLSDAVVDMDEDLVAELSQQAVDENMDAFEAINQGLSAGMERAGKLFEEEEYFVPELLMCADAMNAGVEVLKPHIKSETGSGKRHRVIIGVIEGDTHDIGKNLVKLMMETAGFEMIDLGRDVPAQRFVDEAEKQNAELIMVSSLMTTTMDAMGDVVKLLEERGLHGRIKYAVGGGPVSQGFANKIGADGYSRDAADAVRMSRRLLG
ncbi:MAG: corrinoid protein [Candidatus Fimadaptatus sp.]